MREIRTSGSVRGGGGNVPTYSAGVVKNFTIQQALQQLSNFHGNTLEFYSAAALINRNINQVFSIDTFLDAHSDNQYVTRVGKMLIAYVILKAERSSTLMINPTDHPGATLAVFAHSPLFG